jgi:hypothetical protein
VRGCLPTIVQSISTGTAKQAIAGTLAAGPGSEL